MGRLQPQELDSLIEGYQLRREIVKNEREHHEFLMAYFTSQIINVSGRVVKHMVSPKDLLKPLRKAPEKKRDKSEEEQYLRDKFKHRLNGGV